MRANPRSDWTIGDIETVCDAFGVICSPPSGGGSHYKVAHQSQAEILTIPARRPIKAVYVRPFVGFIDAVMAATNENS
jgi:hypothetical protein